MITQISRDNFFYAFSPDLKPAARTKLGDEIIFETHDCFQEKIQSEEDLVDALDENHTNPATGPVYIEGVLPQSVVRLTVLDVQVDDR